MQILRVQRGKTMSNSWSLWRLDSGCFTFVDRGVGGEQCLLDRDKGGAVEKMGAEFEDKHGGRGWVKIFAFAAATTRISSSPPPAEPQQWSELHSSEKKKSISEERECR